MSMFVLERSKQPAMPCSQRRASKLRASGRTRVHRLDPVTIRLTDRRNDHSVLQPLHLYSSTRTARPPAATVCGAELLPDAEPVLHIRALMELVYRGQEVYKGLLQRACMRRSRRGRQQHALAAAGRGQGYRPARADCVRRAYQVQPHAARCPRPCAWAADAQEVCARLAGPAPWSRPSFRPDPGMRAPALAASRSGRRATPTSRPAQKLSKASATSTAVCRRVETAMATPCS